ncbi:MAG: ribonuclease H [Microthrixaceae bacterium]
MNAAATDDQPVAGGETVIYTDGACKGNPGPGGWAWAIPGGAWASGFDPDTTNQRMEISAAYQAVLANPGRLRIVSDSTYVVNCFRDGWWKGWESRNWKNSKKEPVANRDLWEPFIELVKQRDITFEWVKGHSGDPMNDLVDRLAVEAVERRSGGSDPSPPVAGADQSVARPDRSAARLDPSAAEPETEAATGSAAVDNSAGATAPSERGPVARDRRVPAGRLWTVAGLRVSGLDATDEGKRLRQQMAGIIDAQQRFTGEVVVLTGARPGAEQIGALAAADAGVPYVVVLPYPDPVPATATSELAALKAICDGADSVVTLETKRPVDGAARQAALARRDGWLRSVSSGAIVVTGHLDGHSAAAEARAAQAAQDQLSRFTKSLGDDVWELSVER